ncbi:MAG: anthrone oxygenase family protein, partial [Planctomycetota bacterium]
MQHINITVINVPMMGTFLGSGVLCLLLAGLTLWQGDVSAAWLTLTGCGLYVVGTIGVTIVFNVPMNEKLAPMPLAESTTADYWQHYLRRWTLWNTVRTVAATAACVVLIVSLLL